MVEAPPPDPFQALDLPKDASLDQIKRAYRKLALKTHPDKADEKDKEAAAGAFHRVNQAYEILSDPDKRQKYEHQVRVQQERRETFERSGSFARRPPSHAPQSAGHSRVNSDDTVPRGPYFNARSQPPPTHSYPDHIYEERRPRQPTFDEESTFSRYDAYPREGTSARKADAGYTSVRRTPPKSSNRSDDPPRGSVRQEKSGTKSKEKERRAAATKQRDQTIRKERARGFDLGPSGSETDTSIDDRRAPPMQSRVRASSRDSDSLDDRRTKYDAQDMGAREHIMSSRYRNDPPVPPTYRRDAFATYESAPPRRDATEPERRNSTRPSLFRRSSSKAKEPPAPRARAASYAEKKPPSSAGAARMADHPSLYHSSSTPASGSRLSNMVNGRKPGRRSDSDDDDDDYPPPKPGLKRAETLPVRPSRQNSFAGRRQSEAPKPIKTERTLPSDSRVANNDDSGYSTSSPSESPSTEIPQTAPPKTHTYSYSANKSATNDAFPRSSASEQFPGSTRDRTPRTAQSERFPGPPMDDYPGTEFRSPDFRGSSRFGAVPSGTDLRSPGTRARNSPSPHSRNASSTKHAYPAPPPSRSASYQPHRDSGRDSDRERDAPPSRRPSLSRSNSATKNSTSSKPPSFSRSSTNPLHLNTKLRDNNLLFGEQTASPTEYHSSGPDSGRERDRDREGSSRRRLSEDQRPGSSRTANGRRTVDEKVSFAKRQIDRSRDDKSPRSPRARMFGLV